MAKPTSELSKERGNRVKQLLKGLQSTNFKKMKQVELAEKMGISPIVLSAKLSGSRTLTRDDAIQIADLFPPIRYQWILAEDDFETELHQRLFTPVSNFRYHKHQEQAVNNFLKPFGIEFRLSEKPTVPEMSVDELFELPEEQIEKLLDDEAEYISSDRAYSLSEIKTGKVLALFSMEEYKAFVSDINDYVEFKLNKIIERSSSNG